MHVKRYVNGELQSTTPTVRVALLEDSAYEAQAFIQLTQSSDVLTTWCPDGESFLELVARESFDLLVLDWRLPGISGYEVLRRVRVHQPGVPILMLTANAHELDMVRALDGGADDYIVKPWRQHELLARIRRMLRPQGILSANAREVKLHGLVFDFLVKKVGLADGTAVELAPKEFDVALLLFRHMSRPVSRAHLLESVWREEPEANRDTRKVDTTVSRMRQKLNLCAETGFLLQAEYGIGYRLLCIGHCAETLDTLHGSHV